MENRLETSRGQGRIFLFWISFLSLFLELLLIRWVGTEIRIFAYFRNLVLISCFLGLGIGFSLKKYSLGLLTSIILIAALAGAIYPGAEFHGISLRKIPEYLVYPGFHAWHTTIVKTTLLKLVVGFALITALMMVLAGIFIPFGQILGKIFEASDNRIRDYSINLLGSLLGTWTFALLSFLNAPPWVWFLVGVGGMVYFIRPRSFKMVVGAAALIPILLFIIPGKESGTLTYWSPYQKLTVYDKTFQFSPDIKVPFQRIEVNNTSYMSIFNLSYAQADRFPAIFNRQEAPYYPYDLPYRFQSKPKQVLIVGGGAGNDAASALRNGAENIDVVEIDPTIATLGILLHPEQPYQNPKVNLTIDDARSFFKKSTKKYNLIIFGLLDSHTLTSNFTNINLDSYVYTLESIKEAKNLLAEGGVMVITFYTEREWLGYKLYSLVDKVFNRPPIMLNNLGVYPVHGTGGSIMFVCGDLGQAQRRIESDPMLLNKISKQGIPNQKYTGQMKEIKFDIPTDDWPYLYLQKKGFTFLHSIMTVILLLLMLLAIRFLFQGGKTGPSHFLFLGAGFMLVEVHSISKVALLFGSTWIVNVVIISAILVMILAANLLVLKYQIERLHWWYGGLFLSLALTYLIPVHHLLFGGYLIRGLISGAFYSLPLFFAGVIFACSIRRVAGIEAAFASNMVGAAIGGMLESASFIFGLRAVVLIAILLYLASALGLRRMPMINPVPGLTGKK